MSENKDHMIKLFGRKIKLSSNFGGDTLIASRYELFTSSTAVDYQSTSFCQKLLCSLKQDENRGYEETSRGEPIMETNPDEKPSSSSTFSEDSKTQAIFSTINDKNKEDQSDKKTSTNSQDPNSPKMPDNTLPCPRCSSMATKFCYFNNYNANQPRHFCKNCQRYWTVSGTIRNVPVGSRRRNCKTTIASQHSHLLSVEGANGLTHHPSRSCGSNLGSKPNSSSLGKHYRDGTMLRPLNFNSEEPKEEDKLENHKVLRSNKMRIDCPNKAARSSIWDTIRIKNDKAGSLNRGGGFFRGLEQFNSRNDHDERVDPNVENSISLVLQANPAAFSRSLAFHEITQ